VVVYLRYSERSWRYLGIIKGWKGLERAGELHARLTCHGRKEGRELLLERG
jgi:hypothetical protein